MNLPTTLCLAGCAGLIAFFVGSRNIEATNQQSTSASHRPSVSDSRRNLPSDLSAVNGRGRRRGSEAHLLTDNAAGNLTRDERMAFLAKSALVFNGRNQKAVMLGLIESLKKDEIEEATGLIGSVQNRGNFQDPEVWAALWKKWGTLDPERCLARFKEFPSGKSSLDARSVMEGWMDTDPAAATSWAMLPKTTSLDAAAAAFAITESVSGDTERLKVALTGLPLESLTTRECLKDYFDLKQIEGSENTVRSIYDQLPADLKPAAWTVALQRLYLSDLGEAATWVTDHSNEPGRDFLTIGKLVMAMAAEDPAATAKWASALPGQSSSSIDSMASHPVVLATERWIRADPKAARVWLQTQPADSIWASTFLRYYDAQEQNPKDK